MRRLTYDQSESGLPPARAKNIGNFLECLFGLTFFCLWLNRGLAPPAIHATQLIQAALCVVIIPRVLTGSFAQQRRSSRGRISNQAEELFNAQAIVVLAVFPSPAIDA
jgi:hypothetical protein